MPTYTSKELIQAPADEVFAFISDPATMPQYLPTVHEARPQGHERVMMRGNAAGHSYESDGHYEADPQARTMRWNSDGENQYSGHMEVQDQGSQCFVTVTLNFEPRPEMEEQFQRQMGSRDAAIQEGLNKALQSIKNIMEGQGGKVPTSADQNRGYMG